MDNHFQNNFDLTSTSAGAPPEVPLNQPLNLQRVSDLTRNLPGVSHELFGGLIAIQYRDVKRARLRKENTNINYLDGWREIPKEQYTNSISEITNEDNNVLIALNTNGFNWDLSIDIDKSGRDSIVLRKKLESSDINKLGMIEVSLISFNIKDVVYKIRVMEPGENVFKELTIDPKKEMSDEVYKYILRYKDILSELLSTNLISMNEEDFKLSRVRRPVDVLRNIFLKNNLEILYKVDEIDEKDEEGIIDRLIPDFIKKLFSSLKTLISSSGTKSLETLVSINRLEDLLRKVSYEKSQSTEENIELMKAWESILLVDGDIQKGVELVNTKLPNIRIRVSNSHSGIEVDFHEEKYVIHYDDKTNKILGIQSRDDKIESNNVSPEQLLKLKTNGMVKDNSILDIDKYISKLLIGRIAE